MYHNIDTLYVRHMFNQRLNVELIKNNGHNIEYIRHVIGMWIYTPSDPKTMYLYFIVTYIILLRKRPQSAVW